MLEYCLMSMLDVLTLMYVDHMEDFADVYTHVEIIIMQFTPFYMYSQKKAKDDI